MDFSQFKAVYIDDEPINLMLIQAYANEFGLQIQCFERPLEAMQFLKTNEVDILFTDYMMPDIDGLELIREFRKYNTNVPVVVITAAGDDQELKLNSLQSGATDFLSKPVDMSEFKARTSNLLALRFAQMKLEDRALHLEDEIEKATQKIKQREYESLDTLTKAAEYKNPETAYHTARVALYSKVLAKAYGLDKRTQEIIYIAAPFHDLGKVGIPDNILLKCGKLDNDEDKIMKTHATIGYEILKECKSKYLKEGATIALHHHEKYDGSGYPNALVGQDIPISARIVAIADVFDALTTNRPYKTAWSIEDAIALLLEEKGKHFDPHLVDLFIDNLNEIKKIYDDLKE